MTGDLVRSARNRGVPLDAVNARNLEQIERVGWAVVMVAPSLSESFPPFAYTVGLSRLGHPETMIVGLEPSVANRLLNDLAMRVAELGPLPFGPIEGLLEGGYSLETRPVDPTHFDEYLGRLLWFHRAFGSGELHVRQVIWPDANGRFPDDPSLSPDERQRALQRQPLLNHPA